MVGEVDRPRAFVSSVQAEFRELRDAVRAVVEAAGFEYVGMEGFGSRADEADLTCWLEVASCDLYLGLLGERYGSLPRHSDLSYTEREYRYARLLDLPCYVFLTDEDGDDARQRAFRDRARQDLTISGFTGVDDLAPLVERALRDWRSMPHPRPGTLFGRRRLLREVHEALARPGGGAILVGLPGMGKSAVFDTLTGWFAGDRGPGWDISEVRVADEGPAHRPPELLNGTGRHCLIAIDNVRDDQTGELIDQLRRMRHRDRCSVLITTRSPRAVERLHGLRLKTFAVDAIEAGAAEQLLTWEVVRAAGHSAADYGDLAELQAVLGGVARVVGGYPEALVLVGARIGTSDSSLANIVAQARAMERALLDPSGGTDVLQGLEERLLPYVLGSLPPSAVEVLATLSVLLPRPASIAGSELEVLWSRGRRRRLASGWLQAQLDHLVRARLLLLDDAGRYQMHGIVARHVQTRHLKPPARRRLHRVAAELFHSRVQTNFDSLTSMFAIETTEWQEAVASWLYHLAPIDFTRALFWLVSWYLDAFWWWGCYVPFPLCDLLLHAWEQAQVERAAQDRHRASIQRLRTLHEEYPRGWWLGVPPSLAHVAEALRGLAAVTNVDLDEPLATFQDADGSRLHLRGLLHLLVADCLSPTRFDDANRHYELAVAAFELRRRRFDTEVDAWNEAWIAFEQADHHARYDRLDEAERLCRTAEDRELERVERTGGEDPLLHELLANVARVRADIAWKREDYARAGSEHALAVFRAYAFQVLPPQTTIQGEPGSPAFAFTGGPDPYTVRFYEEMCTRARARYEQLQGSRPAEAAVMAAALRRVWEPCREASGELFTPPLDWRRKSPERIEEAWRLVRCVLPRLRPGT